MCFFNLEDGTLISCSSYMKKRNKEKKKEKKDHGKKDQEQVDGQCSIAKNPHFTVKQVDPSSCRGCAIDKKGIRRRIQIHSRTFSNRFERGRLCAS